MRRIRSAKRLSAFCHQKALVPLFGQTFFTSRTRTSSLPFGRDTQDPEARRRGEQIVKGYYNVMATEQTPLCKKRRNKEIDGVPFVEGRKDK
jgi:hypothetical protein